MAYTVIDANGKPPSQISQMLRKVAQPGDIIPTVKIDRHNYDHVCLNCSQEDLSPRQLKVLKLTK